MHAIPVLFNINQQAASNSSYSPSAQKPLRVVREWERIDFSIGIKDFLPASRKLFYSVHDRDYVNGVFDLTRKNGFGNRNVDIALSLPWTTGSMIAAAEQALANKMVACSPTSGFHHAHYHRGCKYCTFNGLLVTVCALIEQGFVSKIGILDLDAHWADGTEDILKHVPELQQKVEHFSFGRNVHDFDPAGIARWLQELPEIVARMASQCGLIVYQAGADPHLNDPLGGFMSSEQMRLRDQIVFETCKKAQVPVAWNLAGGYQQPFQRVLDLHNATMEECIRVFIKER